MSKSILMSFRPEWVAKILNGEKTIEVRKLFPKDYVGWVYMYCSKGNKKNWHLIEVVDNAYSKTEYEYDYYIGSKGYLDWCLEGKVVARFWCDKVSGIWKTTTSVWLYETEMSNKLYEKSCLSDIELDRYFKPKALGFRYTYGFAIHISKLEIFDKPKELSEFSNCDKYPYTKYIGKAPQNYCYVEGELL